MACSQTQKTKEENQKTKEDEHAFFFLGRIKAYKVQLFYLFKSED